MYHEDEQDRVEGKRSAAIVVRDGSILLIHRFKSGQEYYTCPGGHPRQNEKLSNAAIRETAEETGMVIVGLKLVLEFSDKDNNFNYYYLCSWKSGDKVELKGEELVRNSAENSYEPLWLSLDKVRDINLVPEEAKEWVLDNLF